jgi:hypothetical protein
MLLFISLFTKWSSFHGNSILSGMTFSFYKKEKKKKGREKGESEMEGGAEQERNRSGTGPEQERNRSGTGAGQ